MLCSTEEDEVVKRKRWNAKILLSRVEDLGGEEKRMEGIFKKVLNPSSLRRADKKALTLYFIRECSMSSEIWKVSRIPVSGNKVLLSPALPSMSIRQTRRGPLKPDRKEPSNISLKFYREYSCRLSCATEAFEIKRDYSHSSNLSFSRFLSPGLDPLC